MTAASAAVATQLGVGKDSVRRWVVQAQVDGGQRQGAASQELNGLLLKAIGSEA